MFHRLDTGLGVDNKQWIRTPLRGSFESSLIVIFTVLTWGPVPVL